MAKDWDFDVDVDVGVQVARDPATQILLDEAAFKTRVAIQTLARAEGDTGNTARNVYTGRLAGKSGVVDREVFIEAEAARAIDGGSRHKTTEIPGKHWILRSINALET